MAAFISVGYSSRAISHNLTSAFSSSRAIIRFTGLSRFTLQRSRRSNVRLCQASAASGEGTATPDLSSAEVEASSQKLRTRRLIVFVGMSLTYAAYVFLRSTFTYVAPVMAKSLSLSLPQLGKISSAFPLAYGASRLVTGVIVDRVPAHQALCAGLFLAGIVNITMSTTSSILLLAALWALNGLVQGVGAGASAKMLTAWFSPAQRGFYWALWSTSANFGAFFAPLVCSRLAAGAGFRAGLLVPGAGAAIWAAIVVLLLKSSPAQAGIRVPWEEVTDRSGSKYSKNTPKSQDKTQWRTTIVNGVLRNRTIWALAAAYFFVYFVRNGTKGWLHFWLAEARGCSAADAASRTSGMEVGGIAGTFSAGILSDVTGGRRVVVTLLYLGLVVAALGAAWMLPTSAPSIASFATFAAVGFAINGPQMMIGLIGAEACDRRVIATATGILGWISYLGAAASGLPLSLVIRNGGWTAYFVILAASCVCSMLCLAPLWKLRAGQTKR